RKQWSGKWGAVQNGGRARWSRRPRPFVRYFHPAPSGSQQHSECLITFCGHLCVAFGRCAAALNRLEWEEEGAKKAPYIKGGAMSTQIRPTSAPARRSVDKGRAIHVLRARYRQAGDGERHQRGEQIPALHTEPWRVQRLRTVMEPDLADPREAGGF